MDAAVSPVMPMEGPGPGERLRAAGWAEPDVRRFEQLWAYRRRWGAANLEQGERQFLRRAEAALQTQQRTQTPVLRREPGDTLADCFVALDFETADQGRDSACSIALVRVEGRTIMQREHRLIRPPRRSFTFTSIHGISWSQVAEAPTFCELWPQLAPLLAGARFIAAHNASFDAGVMRACCERAALELPDVCRHLGLALRHHDALSDAEACAAIVLAAS